MTQQHDREPTGSHAIPPPPMVEMPRDPFASAPPTSEPPISAKGATWKTIAQTAIVLAGVVASALGISHQIGESAADARARDRELSAAVEIIDRRTERIDSAQGAHRDEITVHRERLAATARRLDAIERELNKRRDRRDRANN